MIDSNDERILCKRRGRTFKRKTTSGAWRSGQEEAKFWIALCLDKDAAKTTVQGMNSGAAKRAINAPKYEEFLKKLSKEHGQELKWDRNLFSPVRCMKCEARGPFFQLLSGNLKFPKCEKDPASTSFTFEELKAFLQVDEAKPEPQANRDKSHQWEYHPYTAFCKKCGFYTHRLSKFSKALVEENCGKLPGRWDAVDKDTRTFNRTLEQRRRQYDAEEGAATKWDTKKVEARATASRDIAANWTRKGTNWNKAPEEQKTSRSSRNTLKGSERTKAQAEKDEHSAQQRAKRPAETEEETRKRKAHARATEVKKKERIRAKEEYLAKAQAKATKKEDKAKGRAD